MKKIKALLIDSGRVLNEPSTGHWFIPPSFFTVVDKSLFDSISKRKIGKAFQKGYRYIESEKLIQSEEHEVEVFSEFYRIIFSRLKELNAGEDVVKAVTHDFVFNKDKYRFFDEVSQFLEKSKQNFKLAVVSDAWPSLAPRYQEHGYRHYFSSFVISSVLGVSKPHPQMYKTALDELGVNAEAAVFIDDNKENCDGAKNLGINSFLLCRDIQEYRKQKKKVKEHTVIQNLEDIFPYLGL